MASGSNSTSSDSGLCAENSSGNAKTSITEAGSYTVLTITALGVMLFSPLFRRPKPAGESAAKRVR